MARREIGATGTSSASPEAVWALLADITTWSDWGSWDSAVLGNQRGADAPTKHQIRRDALRTN